MPTRSRRARRASFRVGPFLSLASSSLLRVQASISPVAVGSRNCFVLLEGFWIRFSAYRYMLLCVVERKFLLGLLSFTETILYCMEFTRDKL